MPTNKLTLSIDADAVKKAKRYVAAYGTSLSRLLAHIEQGRGTGDIAARTLTTLHYLLSEHLGQQ